MNASLPPSVPSSPGMDASLPSSVPSLPTAKSASSGGISGLGVADLASDSDLPPDIDTDAELLAAEGSASSSSMSWHGVAEPDCPDVDLPPDPDVLSAWDDVTDLNAWDDVTDEVDEVIGPQDLLCAGDHKVPTPAETR